MKRRLTSLGLAATFILSLVLTLTAEEGMYPLSEIAKLNLSMKGLRIPVTDVYNPDGVSLVDAICDVSGGTGEFVSEDGLILTNHHIAFSGVSAASTPENDYLKNGFVASTREQEIPAKDYTCRITESYKDVSASILEGLTAETPPLERSKIVRERMASLATQEKAGRENIECEVSEMFPGKSYVLFTYRIILDVRMVFVPPQSVGEFGGENDNWMWPRHNGDFSFLRAYVAPDGSTATYSPENVPFRPKKFLRFSQRGIKEGDFVMILGYPGRTFRHKTSHFLALQEDHTLPFISSHFDWLIKTMEELSVNDRALQLQFADMIKSYANVTKNYKGKMQGLRRLSLVARRQAEEKALQEFIDADPALKAKYGTTLESIGSVYRNYNTVVRQELLFNLLNRTAPILQIATSFVGRDDAAMKDAKKNEALKAAYARSYDEMNMAYQKAAFKALLIESLALPEDQQFDAVETIVDGEDGEVAEKKIADFVDAVFSKSIFASKSTAIEALSWTRKQIKKHKDPMIKFATEFQQSATEIRTRLREREGELNRLEAELLDAKMLWQKKSFIPDANSTLRFTYGYVRGYAPADAVKYSPMTSLRGILEKNTGRIPYDAPARLLELYETRSYDKSFEDPALDDVPVAILYNTDTTGGNSGSPVMNGWGELVAVNFDRTFEATINDYQWSESYSRSIGVDARYILFIAKYLGGAESLLSELGISSTK